MLGLTGFVTHLCPPGDSRPRVFSRYYHVRRVAWTADLLLQSAQDPTLEAERLRWFSWAHDLNRWPFAHNSEKDIFDQADDLPRYFSDAGITVPQELILELQGIVNKDYTPLKREAKLVLLADILSGFVEDPLWLIAALNVSPNIIPQGVVKYLGLPLNKPDFIRQLAKLAEAFHPCLMVEEFMQLFDAQFQQIMTKLVEKQQLADPMVLGSADFEKNRYLIKETFMRGVVFPYNNERVSHGASIRREVMLPLLDQLGNTTASGWLTQLTDSACIAEAIERSIIREQDVKRFYPDLDFVALHEPENSFSNYLKQTQ